MSRIVPLALGAACLISLAASAPAPVALPPEAAPPPVVRSYKVLMGGRDAGAFEETATVENGWAVRRSTFSYNDRGRGPSLGTGVVFDAAGLPSQQRIRGIDYWKNPVEETQQLAGGKSSWKNGTDEGKGGIGFYASSNASPGELPALARALRRAPEHRLPLLPEGEASLTEAAAVSIETGGKVVPLSLVAVQGLDLTPRYLWLDGEGEMFAALSGWLDVVRDGGQKAVPDLWRRQMEAMAAAERQRAAELAHKPAGPLVFRGARSFDPASGEVRDGTTVIVRGDRIQLIGADAEVEIPADAEIIDAAGKTLMPGLWDMHVHLQPGGGLLHLANGITTVRDMGNELRSLVDRIGRFDRGEELGPRVVAAGMIDGPGPFAGPTGAIAGTEQEALSWVDRYAASGFAQIKLYSSLPPALVPAIAARAHAKGLRLSGHIPYGLTASQAVAQGYDEIQHVNFLFLNFWPEVDTRTPARFGAVGQRAAALDLGSPPVVEFLRQLKTRGTVIDPTLNAFEDILLAKEGQPSPSVAAAAARFPPQVRRGTLGGGFAVPAGQEAAFRASFPALLAFVGKLRDNGIPIVAGTDAMPGFVLAHELELYVQAGYPAREVLRIATLDAARVMKRDADLGSIAPGKLADLILIDGDPTKNISDVRKVVLTVKGGTVYDPAKLCQAVGIKPWNAAP